MDKFLKGKLKAPYGPTKLPCRNGIVLHENDKTPVQWQNLVVQCQNLVVQCQIWRYSAKTWWYNGKTQWYSGVMVRYRWKQDGGHFTPPQARAGF